MDGLEGKWTVQSPKSGRTLFKVIGLFVITNDSLEWLFLDNKRNSYEG